MVTVGPFLCTSHYRAWRNGKRVNRTYNPASSRDSAMLPRSHGHIMSKYTCERDTSKIRLTFCTPLPENLPCAGSTGAGVAAVGLRAVSLTGASVAGAGVTGAGVTGAGAFGACFVGVGVAGAGFPDADATGASAKFRCSNKPLVSVLVLRTNRGFDSSCGPPPIVSNQVANQAQSPTLGIDLLLRSGSRSRRPATPLAKQVLPSRSTTHWRPPQKVV